VTVPEARISSAGESEETSPWMHADIYVSAFANEPLENIVERKRYLQ